jgi:DMSO/TMAO reductase YedYZ molybdopterin-dependent catalytic subunit
MRIKRAITGAAFALVISIPWLAVLYAGQQVANLPLIPISFFEWITRVLPGGLITFGLEAMIQALHALRLGPTSVLGKALEFVMAYILSLIILTLMGAFYAVTIAKARPGWYIKGLAAGLILWLFVAPLAAWSGWGATTPLIGAAWLLVLSLLWGVALSWGVDIYLQTLEHPGDVQRRRIITRLIAGSFILGGLAVLLPRWLAPDEEEERVLDVEIGTPGPTEPAPTPPPAEAGFTPIEGTRPEITPIEDFYRVDINLLPPGLEDFEQETDSFLQRLRAQGETEIQAESYLLVIDGLVENPSALDLNAIKAFPMMEQYATLECISNPVAGDLISTTLFQGARLKDVLDRARLRPEAVDIKFTCVDGYTESLPLESVNDPRTILCYSMGNQPLTQEHGAPLRLYTPDRFGMKNPKWIIKIEAVDTDYFGYWEQRGWSEQAWVKTTSVIDTIQKRESGRIEAGGIAFSGARGIQRVEVRVDEGEWVEAQLDRPLSPLTWVLWRANLELSPGRHTVTVRAVDGEGEVQTARRAATLPDGASGHHSMDVEVG